MKKIVLFIIISFLLINNTKALVNENELIELNSNIKKLEDKLNGLETDRLDKTYPIGSIYITTTYATKEQVKNALGGSWEVYGSGRTIVGVDSDDDSFNTVNKTGGENSTKLLVENLPTHTHNIPSLSGTAIESGKHTHTKGTMNITGSFDIRSYSGEYHDTILDTEGAFSKLVTSWPGEHDILQSTSLNPAYYHNVNFNATNSWTGNTSSDGAHTHDVTTTASTTGAQGSGTAFTNLQPYITVYMYKRVG